MALQPGDYGILKAEEYLGSNKKTLRRFIFIIKIQVLQQLLQIRKISTIQVSKY